MTQAVRSVSFAYHHIGVFSTDRDASTKMFCELLGHGVEAHEDFFGTDATMLTQQHCDLQLAVFAGAPEYDGFGEPGGVGYVALEVEDLGQAVAELRAAGVQQLAVPDSNDSYHYAAVLSCEGLPIVLVQPRALSSRARRAERPSSDFKFRLTHTGVLTDDLSASERFWRTNFGLHRFSKNDCDGSGFLALSDHRWEPGRHTPFMEILCPPNVLNVDQRGYDLRGVSYYHLSYYCSNVRDAWQHLVDGGLLPTLPAYVEPGTLAEGAFVTGLDGIAIEVFGGASVDDLIQHPDIAEVDEVFSVSAAELSRSSGPMTSVPPDHRGK